MRASRSDGHGAKTWTRFSFGRTGCHSDGFSSKTGRSGRCVVLGGGRPIDYSRVEVLEVPVSTADTGANPPSKGAGDALPAAPGDPQDPPCGERPVPVQKRRKVTRVGGRGGALGDLVSYGSSLRPSSPRLLGESPFCRDRGRRLASPLVTGTPANVVDPGLVAQMGATLAG